MAINMQVRRGTAAAWTAANPTLLAGEIGYETDSGKFKVGDGATAWTGLAYSNPGPTGPTGPAGQVSIIVQDGIDGDEGLAGPPGVAGATGAQGAGLGSGQTLAWFTAGSNEPPASGFMTLNVRNGHLVLEATAGSTDTAIFTGIMPRSYAGGGLTVSVHWMAKTAVTGTIGWDASFERDNAANHDLNSDAFATAQNIAAAAVNGTSGKITTTSVAVTAGANTDSIAAGDPFRLRIRNLAAGTATGGNQILAVEIKET